jgi:hypothetical protein
MPVPMAMWSMAHIVFNRSNTGIVANNSSLRKITCYEMISRVLNLDGFFVMIQATESRFEETTQKT